LFRIQLDLLQKFLHFCFILPKINEYINIVLFIWVKIHDMRNILTIFNHQYNKS
jgi:hypothetical protein